MIKIINLYKDYVSSSKTVTNALKNINLDLPDKGFVSILGPSGCGKSTLLNLLGALDTPTKGRVYIDGTLVNQLTDKEKDLLRNKYFGFVFQSYHLISTLTASENIELPLLLNSSLDKEEINEKVGSALDSVNLVGQEKKKSSEMSGGQMQRIAIARALINDPKIVLADEPTGALDSKNSLVVMDLLKEISKDRLVVIVTHNQELAEVYSDEIVRLKDGEIQEISMKNPLKVPFFKKKTLEKRSKKSFFKSEKIIWSLSFKNMFSKRLKTILTALANCFGLVSLGIILALTHGFSVYSEKVSEATSSFLPINVPAYSVKGDQTSWMEINQSTEFPEKEEIYPYVINERENDYTYNVYTQDYFELLDKLIEENLASQYLINYGNDYSYNLITEFPESIDGKSKKEVREVKTSVSAGGSYTSSSYGIPTNIFHPLYGRYDEMYDVIAGKMPTNKYEIVLVVNSYNAINFDVLKELGFYSYEDSQAEVMKKALESKVTPISFDDIIGGNGKEAKKYKVFTNNEFFNKTSEDLVINDFFSTDTSEHSKSINQFETNDLENLYKNGGKELTISGILRPKKDSSLSLLSPSLCYLPELQDEINSSKKESSISSSFYNNIIGVDDESHENRGKFISEMSALSVRYQNGKFDFNASSINEVMDRYFDFYSLRKEKIDEDNLISFQDFLKQARLLGVDLVDEETVKACLSKDRTTVYNYFQSLYSDFYKVSVAEQNYKKLLSFAAFLNSYSDVINVSIFPRGLEQRRKILIELDNFNASKSKEEDKIYYFEYENPLIKTMGNMIGLVQMVLGIFVAVLVVVACAMNILFTYNSVLERKKDIGILRAIGTSKGNVSKLFIIESGIIGSISGLFSSLFSYLLCIPINIMAASYFEEYFVRYNKIAVLTWYHPLILLGMGAILGILSSLIPSYSAAKKDPVECLKEN